jgi:Tfp pilus assembly protein PilN
MIPSLVSWLNGTNYILGLEVQIQSDGSRKIFTSLLHHANGSVTIIYQSCVESIEKIQHPSITKDIPVAVNISGKGILFREVIGVGKQLEDKIQAAIPVSQSDHLVKLTYPMSQGVLLSLMRQEVIEDVKKEITAKFSHLLFLTFGFCTTHQFFALANLVDPIMNFGGYKVLSNTSSELTGYTIDLDTHKIYSLGNEKIDQSYIQSYAVGFIAILKWTKRLSTYDVQEDEILSLNYKWEKFNLKNRSGLVYLGTLMIILLINFFLFQNLKEKNEAKSIKLSYVQKQLKILDSLQHYIKEKEKLVQALGVVSSSSTTQILDKLAATVPEAVQLSELTIHPINDKESRIQKNTVFDVNEFRIKGNVTSVEKLNDWIKVIDKVKGIESIKIEDYTYNNSLNIGTFILKGEIK